MSRVDAKYLELLRTRYRAAGKKEKGVILDEFVKTTGYGRKYVIALLTAKRDYVKGPVRRPRMTTYTSCSTLCQNHEQLSPCRSFPSSFS